MAEVLHFFYVRTYEQKTGLVLNSEIRHPSSLASEEGREWMLNGEPGRVLVSGSRKGRARHADRGRFVFR